MNPGNEILTARFLHDEMVFDVRQPAELNSHHISADGCYDTFHKRNCITIWAGFLLKNKERFPLRVGE